MNDQRPNASILPFVPKPGDRFTSEGNFWVHVVAILGPYIVVEEYDLPCAAPDDARVRIFKNLEQFQATYLMPGSNRYWIHYVDDDAPLRHLEFGKPESPRVWTIPAPEAVTALRIAKTKRAETDALFELVAEQLLLTTGASGAAVALREPQGLLCRAATGMTAPQPGMVITDPSGLLTECLRHDRLLRCDDTEATEVLGLASFRKAGINSLLVVPLRNAMGLLGVFSTDAYAFGEREIAAVCLSSEILSRALELSGRFAAPVYPQPELLAALA